MATQSPRGFRRSSWSQFRALPTSRRYSPGRTPRRSQVLPEVGQDAASYGRDMYAARSIWIAATLVSFGLMALIFSRLSGGEARAVFFAELAAFTVSFLSARFLGGPGKVLLIGIALAFG